MGCAQAEMASTLGQRPQGRRTEAHLHSRLEKNGHTCTRATFVRAPPRNALVAFIVSEHIFTRLQDNRCMQVSFARMFVAVQSSVYQFVLLVRNCASTCSVCSRCPARRMFWARFMSGQAALKRPAAALARSSTKAAKGGQDPGSDSSEPEPASDEPSELEPASDLAAAKAQLEAARLAVRRASKKGACTPKKAAKAKVVSATKCAKTRSPVTKPSSLKFPGIPKGASNPPPLLFNGFKVYTSVAARKWRALKVGERVDVQFSFGASETTARVSWKKLVDHIGGAR